METGPFTFADRVWLLIILVLVVVGVLLLACYWLQESREITTLQHQVANLSNVTYEGQNMSIQQALDIIANVSTTK
jgi:uncharacterized membrane protein (Fun14 family)